MSFRALLRLAYALLAASSLPGNKVYAQEREPAQCFDVEVVARVIHQTPSVAPEFDDGSIVMRWPWFVDIDVERVNKGKAALGKVTVLSVQHTYWRSDLASQRWQLRRNDQGTYNLLGLAKRAKRVRCERSAPPAEAYLTPGKGSSFQKLRDDGEKRYGERP